jgi:hypothetical protein
MAEKKAPAEFPEELALNIVLGYKENMLRLADAIKKTGAKLDIRQMPLAYPAEDPTEIVVHPNVILDFKKSLDIKNALKHSNLRTRFPSVFNTIRGVFNTDMANIVKRRRWEHVENIFARKEKTTYARFFRNHLKLEDAGFKDDVIRDIAQKIEFYFRPPALIICKEPKDYAEMFQVDGKTCMSPGSNHYSPLTKQLVKEGRNPGEWFFYNPHTQGVFIRKDGKAVARGMLVRDDPEKPFLSYCNIVGSTPEFIAELQKLIVQAGYKPYNGAGWGQVHVKTTFEVPATASDNKVYSPLPFHDSVYCSYYITYDDEKKVFVYGPAKDAPKKTPHVINRSPYDFKGFIQPGDIGTFGKIQYA